MKRIFCLAAAVALSLFSIGLSAQVPSNSNPALKKQWGQVEKALNADLPKEVKSALESIKVKAKEIDAPWDYYQACMMLISNAGRMDWKSYSSTREAEYADMRGYGCPVMEFCIMESDDRASFVDTNRDALMSSKHSEFHSLLSGASTAPLVGPSLGNDYEFCIWQMFYEWGTSVPLKKYYGDSYPMAAYVAYEELFRTSEKKREGLEESFVKKYEGKAVAGLVEMDRLERRFRELDGSAKSSSSDFLALKSDVEAFHRSMGKFSGTEAPIAAVADRSDQLLQILEMKTLDVIVENGNVTVLSRNVPSCTVELLRGKELVYRTRLESKSRPFYKNDSLKCTLPRVDDGDYTVRCCSTTSSDVKSEVPYSRYSLSLAIRKDSGGWGCYVADYNTGEPVKSFDLEVLQPNGKVLYSGGNFVQKDGFVRIPYDFPARKNASVRVFFKENGMLRSSAKNTVYGPYEEDVESAESDDNAGYCCLLTDRSAYNPGDTIKFKCIVYSGRYDRKVVEDAAALWKAYVCLYDSEGKLLVTMGRRAMEASPDFGSLSGSVVIPEKARGGMWRLEAKHAGSEKSSDSRFLRVDEFVLPTFEVEWGRNDRFYFPGDSIVVKGRVRSYSGHVLADADVSWQIRGSGVQPWRKLELASDGSFEMGFRASDREWDSYPVNLRVVDGTGETLEFSTYVWSGTGIHAGVNLENACRGEFASGTVPYGQIMGSEWAEINIDVPEYPALEVNYKLLQAGKALKSGAAEAGKMKLDMKGLPSGMYEFVVDVRAVSENGREYTAESRTHFLRVLDADMSLDCDVTYIFKDVSGDEIAVQAGSTDGPLWVVAELFGPDRELLAHRIVRIAGVRGGKGSLERIAFGKNDAWPEKLSMHLTAFKRGRVYSYRRDFTVPKARYVLPLEFTRFCDMAVPGRESGMVITTAPEVECAVTIYDKSLDNIQPNVWSPRPVPFPRALNVDYSFFTGHDRSQYIYYARNGAKGMGLMTKAGNAAAVMDYAVMDDAFVAEVEEECCVFSNGESPMVAPAESVTIREDFAKTIAWKPMLHSDSEGKVSFSFVPGDKLSTFYVQVFAHDRKFNNNVLRREMMVTIPVKVSVVQPQFLYEGDNYVARISLSNNLKTPVEGKVSVSFYEGDYRTGRLISTRCEDVEVAAGGSLAVALPCDGTDISGDLGVLVRFDAADTDFASDAMFVSIPVVPAAQMITEAHSALLKSGQDKDALVAELRSRFLNFDGSLAEVSERSIKAMLAEALPALVKPDGCNAIALSEAVYAGSLAARLNATSPSVDELIRKLSACQNADGGFAWFEDQRSSAMVTAVVLERCASCPEFRQALGEEAVKAAVTYLDRTYFHADTLPEWCGGISFEQYLHVRARYPEVDFQTKDLDADRLAGFRKAAAKYLVPGKVKGLNGQILLKARRVQTIRSLVSSEAGLALARSWSIRFATGRRLGRQVEADMRTLLQYAVEHEFGGWYYPNAVMPWRGLMESELYAHSLMCDLLAEVAGSGMPEIDGVKLMDIADGIRLWIMVQKETQKWHTDPAYIEALSSVFHGTEALLDTKVVVLKGSVELPFPEIKPAGNGMTVERRFSCNGKTIGPGDSLKVGDKVMAEYVITNAENRSFVRIKAWRPASFRPVNQLSGYYGGWCGPFNLGRFVFTPQGHRDVYSDRTEYWFNSFAEGNTTISEEFFVTQEGRFQVPVVEMESLYAPHYRANGSGRGPVLSFEPAQQ